MRPQNSLRPACGPGVSRSMRTTLVRTEKKSGVRRPCGPRSLPLSDNLGPRLPFLPLRLLARTAPNHLQKITVQKSTIAK